MVLYLSILMVWVLNTTFGYGEYITNTNLRRRLNPAITNDKVSEHGGKLWSLKYVVEIAYDIHELDTFPIEQQDFMNDMMDQVIADFNANTNIRLKKRDHEVNGISIILRPPEDVGSPCESVVGDVGDGVQILNLELENEEKTNSCWTKVSILHEILHSLGLGHTQSRNDRDDYVTINFDQIIPEQQHNFVKTPTDIYDDCGYYDYDSVMHYGSTDFGIPNELGEPATTIEPTLAGRVLTAEEDKVGLSDTDIICLDYLYRPKTVPVRIIPYDTPKKYVGYKLYVNDEGTNDWYFGGTDDISKDLYFLQSSTFKLIEPGLAGASDDYPDHDYKTVSFESIEYPSYYMVADTYDPVGITLKLQKYEDTIDFKKYATFFIVKAINGDSDYVSFRWQTILSTYYIRVDGLLYLEKLENQLIPSGYDIEWLNSASFKLECAFVHKTDYVDTCPIDDYSEYFTLTSSKEIKCNKRIMSALIAKGGTKRFTFINDVNQEILFEYIDEEPSGIVKPRVQLKSAINDQLVVAEASDAGGQHFTQLAAGTYFLEVQPETDVAPGGIFSVKVTCAPTA